MRRQWAERITDGELMSESPKPSKLKLFFVTYCLSIYIWSLILCLAFVALILSDWQLYSRLFKTFMRGFH